jgi:hypothetical protein
MERNLARYGVETSLGPPIPLQRATEDDRNSKTKN